MTEKKEKTEKSKKAKPAVSASPAKQYSINAATAKLGLRGELVLDNVKGARGFPCCIRAASSPGSGCKVYLGVRSLS